MTIDNENKINLLETFHTHLSTPGWSFQENGPNEKDAQLLKEFHCVIEEFSKLSSSYQTIITDITRRMGHGMALFLDPTKRVVSKADFQLYMHYVAGLVGIGLTDLFVASGLESKTLSRFSILPTESKPTQVEPIKDIANRMGNNN